MRRKKIKANVAEFSPWQLWDFRADSKGAAAITAPELPSYWKLLNHWRMQRMELIAGENALILGTSTLETSGFAILSFFAPRGRGGVTTPNDVELGVSDGRETGWGSRGSFLTLMVL